MLVFFIVSTFLITIICGFFNAILSSTRAYVVIHEFIWRECISVTPTERQPTPLSCYSQNLNIVPRYIRGLEL